MAKKTYGKTKSGIPIDEELIAERAAEAEAGFEVKETMRRVGRPSIGSGPAPAQTVRLDPELRAKLIARAKQDGEAVSAVIRRALRKYLSNKEHTEV